ncbi:eukaryotic peptide chain release factor GTP-binding subunit ERF3A-like [Mya arenaria]|uniref:eukaryotic peptide chain release factor GTP-binding subunit ERF3A-like n=1 Tax=Mya arenaria TaxID=6604 RepID=UPI0022E40479|nr:eukaryotic peptide chain release factor GTP-binding subunit ERF3A-like [Mya arenaria]XP_052791049.1 eukaryotic peptide chain release factor GTP-binding subunit ERF3A-like [Mya arenaria]
MESSNNQSGAPDEWDDGINDEQVDNNLNKPLAALNIDAPAFVPGQNPYAFTFVPTGVTSNDGAGDTKPDQPPPQPAMEDDVKDEDDGGGAKQVADDWGGAEEDEEEDDEDMDDDSECEVKKPVMKDKIVKKAHMNIIFIGHVDAGKSTIGGQILFQTGMVDKRTLEKYEKEAREKSRESWYLSWALDTNLEEREKGKTVEVGRAYFETENKHFTILDAPGHKSFVPNMIGGASQADIAILVISARRGEFETGFERGGQTREHAMLVKTAGVKKLVVVINKMDDPTVQWDEARYNECKDKLIPYLKKCGFNPKTDLVFFPVSGLTGAFIREIPPENVCPWYRGPAFIEYLDGLPPITRALDKPFRMPVMDRYKDMGTILIGKVESGICAKNQTCLLMPNRCSVKIMQLWSYDEETDEVHPGENVKLKVSGIEEEDISPGFVICAPDAPCRTGRTFDAKIVILEHKSIICAGFSAVLHIHTSAEEATITNLICILDKKTGKKTPARFIMQDQIGIARFHVNAGVICLETFDDFPQMGRFTLRDEGRTVAIGQVLKIVD